MKMKSFAMLATSSLVAAAFMYAVPAMADDEMSNGQTAQQSSMPDSNNPVQGNDSQNIAATPADPSASTSTTTTTGTPTDEGSPDTATGDDDY